MRFFITILTILFSLIAKSQIVSQAVLFVGNTPGVPGAPVIKDTININTWDSASNIGLYSNSAWNNWAMKVNTDENNRWSQYYTYMNGTQSSVQTAWQLAASTTRAITGYVNNFTGTPNYSASTPTMVGFPKEVFQAVAYTNGNDLTRLRIRGLDDSKTYKIRICASRATNTTLVVTYSIGAQSQSVQVNLNLATAIEFTGVSPSSGEITVTCDYTTGTFVFINALQVITE